jgi:antitoxin CptB
MDQIELAAKRKQLLWRAKHRGIKEMDIIVGGFAEAQLPHMNSYEINMLELILEIPDQDLLSWLTAQVPVPADQDSPLLQQLLSTRPKLST